MMKDKLSCKLVDSCWIGELNLGFSFIKGRSVLIERKHCGPFLVQKIFYPEDDKMVPHVYLLHPPGGLIGGDKLILNVQLDSGSQALLTTPGASKFYRTNGMYALQKYTFKLADNTALEWIPQSSIFFPKTKAKTDTTFILGKNAKLISFEMLCFGDVAKLNMPLHPEEVDIFLKISLPNSIGLQERLKLNAVDCAIKLKGYQISALLFAVPSDEKMLNQVRKLITLSESTDCQIGGVTLLDELLVVRLLGNDNQNLKKLLYHIWYTIRPSIIGRKAIIPRVWLT